MTAPAHAACFTFLFYCLDLAPGFRGVQKRSLYMSVFNHYFLRRRYRLSGYGIKGLFFLSPK